MGFGSIVGGVIGFTLGGPAGAAIGAGMGGTNAGQAAVDAAADAAKKAAEVTEEFVEGFGTVLYKAGVAIVDAIGDVAMGSFNILHGTIALRSLRESERNVLLPVFGGSVPLDRVVVSSLIGLSHRPLCIPGSMITTFSWALPGVGPLLGVYSVLRGLEDKYLLCMGPEGYNNSLNMPFDNRRGGQTLVHELTHVWQGHNQAWSWGYLFESLFQQCKCTILGGNPYAVTPGLQWQDYNAEQQGRLTEMWYIGSGSLLRRPGVDIPNAATMAILEAYMNNNVRPAAPKNTVTLPSAMGIGTVSTALITSSTNKANLGGAILLSGSTSRSGAAPLGGDQLTAAQREGFGRMADELYAKAGLLKTSGNIALINQAQQMEAQAAQFMSLSGRRLNGNATFQSSPGSQFLRR